MINCYIDSVDYQVCNDTLLYIIYMQKKIKYFVVFLLSVIVFIAGKNMNTDKKDLLEKTYADEYVGAALVDPGCSSGN